MMMNRNPPKNNSSPPIQILVVEDERIIALNVKESLESLGYKVVGIASSGEKAVAKATELRPNLVLMDIRLKGNMDGIQAAEKIWERLSIPVIYVTGHSDRGTLDRAKITAPFGYILKPVKDQELAVAIEIALQRYEREQLLNAILRGMGDGVILVNGEGRIQFLNQVAASLTGWGQDEARDRELNEVFKLVNEQTQEPVDDPIAAAIQEDTTIYLEENIQLIAKDGTAIPIADSVAPIQDNRGELAAIAIVFRDITQRRLAEERNLALERARQLEVQMTELDRLNRLKDDFLNTISHELRTPLSNIKMAVRLLEMVLNQRGLLSPETLSDSQSMARYLNILQDQCNQELKLINDLLDMRAIDAEAYPLDLTPIQLQDWIPNIVESFTERAQVQQQSLHVRLPTELPVFVSDLSILTRILTELLNNAIKYTPSGEQIVVKVRVVEGTDKGDKGETEVELRSYPSHVQIEVSNSGMELPQEELSRIFEPFYRILKNDPWKHGGTGLGLALVGKLVKCLHGKIEATSDRNWTTFSLEIPSLGLPEEAEDDFDGYDSSER